MSEDTSRLNLVYIASPSCSGSTLLALLLNRHPLVAGVGEAVGLDHLADPEEDPCSCGTVYSRCPFWESVIEGMKDRGHPFDLANFDLRFEGPERGFRRVLWWRSLYNRPITTLRDRLFDLIPSYREGRTHISARNRDFFRVVLESSGSQHFVDASKDPIRFKFLSRIAGVRLRLIHLVRDPCPTANSLRRNFGRSLRESARIWCRTHRDIGRMTVYAENRSSLVVRYEELCSEPKRVLDEIQEYCGLPKRDLTVPTGEPAHVIGNRMSLGWDGTIRLDIRWESELTTQEKQRVTRWTDRVRKTLY